MINRTPHIYLKSTGSVSDAEVHLEKWIKTIDDLTPREQMAAETGFREAINYAASLGMNLVKALQILERNQEAMGHAKFRKISDDELIAVLTYRQAMKPNN